MTFGSTFGRVLSPTFHPNSQAVGGKWWLAGNINPANCVAAYQPKGAANYAASKVNLANPGTYDAADGTTYPDWASATGWTGNASDKYLTTGVAPTFGYSMVVRYSDITVRASQQCIAGFFNTGHRFYLYPAGTASYIYHVYGYGNMASFDYGRVSGASTTGVMAVTPTGGYLNGKKDLTITATFTGIAASGIVIFARRREDISTYDDFSGGNILAMAIYDIDIASYVSALTTAMNAL